MVEQCRDAILFLRRDDGRLLYVNPAAEAAYGYSRDELLALTIFDLRAFDGRPAVESQMQTAAAGGVLFESWHRRKDGSRFPVEVSSRGVNVDGVDLLVSIVRDITERKRAEEAVREADRQKSEFLAVLSHELRNPLAPIRNSVHLLERAPRTSAAAERAIRVLHRQVGQLSRLVDDLLDLNRISHGKIQLQRARLDAREVVGRLCDDARDGFEDRRVALVCGARGEPLWLDADPTRLTQMVGNLLSNALKFTPPGGEVRVSLEQRGDRCEIAVRDTGAGIAPADLERIFDPFVQAERTREQRHGGLGIGLALVRDLALRHGGEIRAASDGPGHGAEFVVSLPLAPAPAGDMPAAAEPAPAPLDILVVEDDEDAGASLADLLALSGHQVRLAATGRAGLAAAEAAPPDVLLCDVGLPDVSGHEVIQRLRAAGSSVFAVALTGYAQAEDRTLALSAGFDAHLSKPPELDELARLLRRATPAPPPPPDR